MISSVRMVNVSMARIVVMVYLNVVTVLMNSNAILQYHVRNSNVITRNAFQNQLYAMALLIVQQMVKIIPMNVIATQQFVILIVDENFVVIIDQRVNVYQLINYVMVTMIVVMEVMNWIVIVRVVQICSHVNLYVNVFQNKNDAMELTIVKINPMKSIVNAIKESIHVKVAFV